MKTNRQRRIRFWLLLFTLACLISYAALEWIVPTSLLKPYRANLAKTPADASLNYEAIDLQTEDDLNLKGYWIRSNADSLRGSIILLHGIGGCKEHFIDLAAKVNQQGYHALVYDARAHGKSGGKYCTYGFYEKKDVSIAVDFIKTNAPELPIGVWGNSLGGAVALQALAYDERLDFGIIESTFTELRQIVFDYKKRISGIGIRWLSDHVLSRAGKIGKFDPDEVRPIESVKNIRQPVLIAHGDADSNIFVDYGKTLFNNLASPQKELIIIEGGNHYNTRFVGGDAYLTKAFDFLRVTIN